MKYLFLISFFFLYNFSFSQKIDLDRESVKVKYIRLPESNALSRLNTYTLQVFTEPATIARLGLRDEEIENALSLPGYQYTKDRSADILLQLTIDHVEVVSESIDSRTIEEKNAQGQISYRTVFNISSHVIAPTYIKLLNQGSNKEVEYFTIATHKDPVSYLSPNFPTEQQAVEFKNKSLAAKRNEFFWKVYKEKFYNVFASLKNKYCFSLTETQELFWKVDLKKNPEFISFNEELSRTKTSLEGIGHTESLDRIKEEMAPRLKYWSENAAKVDPSDKKARKLKYAYLINLARTQYWLEMFNECEATCQSLIDNDFDAMDGKNLLLNIKFTRNSLEIHQLASRHFDRSGFNSVEKFRIAESLRKLEKPAVIIQEEKAPLGYSILPGYILTFENHRIDGELWVKNLDSDLCFMPEANTVFAYRTPEGLKKMSISADNINRLVLGRAAVFECLKFKNKVNDSEQMQLFRILHENDKLKVLKYYSSPSNNKQSVRMDFKMIAGAELCLMRKSDQVIEMIGNFIPKKVADNTAAFYSDCPALKAMITTGEIRELHQLSGQIKAADFFAERCY